jgi:hypothetical protein
MKEREKQRQFFRGMPKTKEFAETNYYRVQNNVSTVNLVQPNSFWAQYANHKRKKTFVSNNFIYATKTFTEMIFALSSTDRKSKSYLTNYSLGLAFRTTKTRHYIQQLFVGFGACSDLRRFS